MDLDEFAEFVLFAKENEKKEHHRAQWTAMLPFMSMGILKYKPFEEYEEEVSGKNIDLRPANEIMKEINDLHSKKGGNAE